jgi:hypothetical protein
VVGRGAGQGYTRKGAVQFYMKEYDKAIKVRTTPAMHYSNDCDVAVHLLDAWDGLAWDGD